MIMAQSLASSFKCAAAGIVHACKTQRNFKIELGFAGAAIVLGVVFAIDAAKWATIAVCIGAVLAGECVNTAMESVVDLVSPEYHELAKHAKDCAAGAVLVMSLASLAVAAFIFLPSMIGLFMR